MEHDELMHYGRKGMKWYQNIYTARKKYQTKRKRKQAVAKARETLQKKRAEETAAKKREEEKQTILKKGSVDDILKIKKELSNEELESAISRIKLEQSLESLAPKPAATDSGSGNAPKGNKDVDKGKEAVNEFLKTSGKKILVDTAVDVGAQTVKYLMVNAVNKKIGEDVVYTNNKKK